MKGQPRFGPGAQVGGLLEALEKGLAAVGVATAVLFHEAHEDGRGADHFRPTHAGGQQVRVAEGHVADGNPRAIQLAFGQGDGRVGQGRTADGLQRIEADDEAPRGGHAVEVRNVPESLPLPLLGALAVVRVEQGQFVPFSLRDGRGHAAIHAAGEGDDCEFTHG